MTTYAIDTSHSAVRFAVRHLVIAKVRGTFGSWRGQVDLDDSDLRRSSVRVEVDIASVDTKEEKRDAHLRSPDFFAADEFPTMSFVSREVLAEGDKVRAVVGDLTIRGITKSVTLEVDDLGSVRDPWGNQRIAFEGKARINRHDFGLRWNAVLETGGVVVGDTVDIGFEIQAVAQQAATAKAS